MAGETRRTTDPQEIQDWAVLHDARPAALEMETGPDLLRFRFPGDQEGLHEISWDEFFELFEEEGLEMLFQHDPTNSVSRYYEFVTRSPRTGAEVFGHAVSAEETPAPEVPGYIPQTNIRE